MKAIDKIIVDIDGKLIHIFFKDKDNNVSYKYSSRFKLVVDTIDKRSENEKNKRT